MASTIVPFTQVDVFTDSAHRGNPVAVVHLDHLDDAGLGRVSTEAMARFAHWTNLSETTFLLPPSDPGADYRVRIFTPVTELPFAGHPTLGTCRAWLDAGGEPAAPDRVVQECAAGLITIRRDGGTLAFAAPPLSRSGPVDDETMAEVERCLGVDRSRFEAVAWADNGPGWVAVLLATPDEVLALRPVFSDLKVGVAAPYPDRSGPDGAALEVRAFFGKDGVMTEDPVTGSLNAALAQWLSAEGLIELPYQASQGTALGRAGRVSAVGDGDTIWIGGGTVPVVQGTVLLP